MAPVSNRFAKYIIQQDDAGGGGSAPAPKQNRFAKYKAVEAPAVQQINPMVAQGRVAQQEWQAAGAKPANPNPENPIVTAQRSSQTQAMSQWAQQREAERQAEAARTKARRESAAAFGGGMDMLPTEDEAGNVRPGTAVDTDISKGVVGAPFQALEAVKDAGVSMANLGGETYNAVNNALTAPFGVKPMQVPKITTPDNPLIGEGGPLQSVTGDLGRNLMQFLIARKIVGNIAPGGGTAAQLGKDAVALGAGFDADTARLSETVNEFVQKSGSPQIAKDYIGWLAERNPSNPLLERFKNMVEDLTISGPLVAPQAVARGAQAVGNAIAPVARTPTNAGGTAARAAVADPFLVRDPAPAPSPVAAPAASAAPQAPVTSVPATRAAPQPPAPPVAPSANAAPPPGTLTPVPNANAATAEFNALPRKVRESVFRAMRNSGFDNNGIIAAIRDLNTLPPERQSMFATELVRKYGAQFPELEANLAAMGRKFAVDTPKPRQIFGRTIERDGARQVMNDEVRSQIDSEADYLNQTVERLFGPGAVPAKEELLRLQQAGGAEYRRLLSTTNRYGRARAPAKRAEIDRNIATLASYLKRPEVMNNVPDWVKQKVMLEVSNDLRQLKFTPDEQAIIVAGDPGLAALFTPDAPLTYSPQLWNTLVDLYPTQSAHSLQSAYAKAIREARFSSDPQTRVWVDTLSRARGKSTVRANARNADDRGFGLLKMLEDAVPGYKEARMKYGNVMGAQEALDDARQFMSIAGDETKLAQFIDDYEDLSDLQRTAVENQVSSIIRQSIANKVDNPKLAELGREGPSTPNLTAISKQPFLDALPKVFGARGQEMADAIRLARSNTDYLTGLHPKYNSRTGVNEADVKNADRIYEDPAGAESSIIDNAVTQGLGGAGLGAAFIPGAAGAALPLIGLAAAKALWTARKAGKRLSPSEKTQLAEFLFRSRRQAATGADGAAAPGGPPQLPGPRGPSPLDTGGNMAAGAAIGAAVGGAASGGDPNAMIAGATTGAGAGAVRAQVRNAASLIKPTRAPNALASPPARPPAKAGTDGTKLNGMGGTPEGIGAATGATAGYLANPTDANGDGVIDDQDRGLNAMGGLVSGGLGVKAVRSGANAARNAMIPQARVMAEAATRKRIQKQMAQVGSPANALASPPRPPEKAGFGRGSKQPLPMDEASRMQRAREQGFDVDTPLYHGSPNGNIQEMNRGTGYLGDGVYLTADRKAAAGYKTQSGNERGVGPITKASRAITGKVYETFVRGKGISAEEYQNLVSKINLESANGNIFAADPSQTRAKMVAQGQLSEQGITHVVDGDLVMVFNPKNVRSTNATFDPSQSGSSKLLAGIGGSEGVGGFGGAVAGGALAPDANNDGVVDAQERAAGAFGGALSGIVGAKAVRAGGNALAKVGKAPSVERGPVRFGGKTDGAGPPSVSDRPWSVEDNRTALPPRPPVKAGFGGSSKPLPMDEASRMGRAREQGFDVDTPLYHGTSGDFDAFRASRSGVFGPGVYVSEDPSVASSYAQRAGAKGGSPNVMPLFVRGRVANDAEYQAAFRQATAEGKQGSNRPLRIAQILKQKGFSGARIPGDGDLVPSQIVVFDPNDIRGKFAAFDPSQSGSSKLLAGIGASPEAVGAIGGGAAGYALAPDQNGDGVVDAQERAAGGLGGFVSGIAGAKIVRGAGNALRNTTPPKGPPSGPAQQTFGGVKAKTADLKLQRIAADMERAGASRDQIIKETGWFKGNDGKWRFEIDDSASRLGDRALEDFVDKGAAQGKAAGVLWNKPVYDAYPEMRDVTISARNAAPASGTWDRSSRIDVEAPTSAEARQMMLHEGQHAVQDTEGFARGGSPDRGNSRDDIQRFAKQAYEESQEISDAQLLWELGGEVGPRPASVASGKKWEDLPLREQVKWYEAGRNRAYRYLAGETEARNVELRRDFTPEERRARPPWTTQDVPDEQQIVRYGSGHANSEPTPRQSITLAETKDANGKPVTVKGEAFNDRGRMVLSPEWPTNAFDELEKARQKAAMDGAFPPKPGPKLVDENYGKPPKPRPEWEVENPKAQAEIDKAVAQRFVGLMNADPSPVHVLALKDGVGLQEIGDIIESGLPKNREIFIAKDGGEIAVVDKAWRRQNPQEYTSERWNYMWPSSVKREGRRYGWKDGRPFIFASEPKPPPTQASFGGSPGKTGGKEPPGNALKDSGMPGPISPRVIEDATKAAGRLSPEARNKLRANAFSDDPAPAMQASGFDPNLFSFAQDARTPPPGKVQNAFARLTGQPTANPLERGLQKSIESVAGQRGRSALRVGNEDVPDLPFGMRMAMGERNATRKEQALARRAYTRAEKADKLDADKVKRVVVAEREARVAQEILDQARLDAFSAEDVGAIVREQMDAIAKAMNREPPSTLGLPTKGQRVSDALDDVVFGAPPKGARARPKAKDTTYSASEADDAAKLLFSKEYARVWDDIVSGRTPVESIKPGSKEHLVLTVAAVGGIGALGVTSALLADRSGPMQEPHYPKPEDPRVHFDWTKQRTNRRFVENLQTRFNQIDRRYQLREDGIWSEGGDTDKVIRFWQDTNGFAPDGNLTEDQVALIEEQAIEALRAEPVGGRSGQSKRPAPRNALAPAQ